MGTKSFRSATTVLKLVTICSAIVICLPCMCIGQETAQELRPGIALEKPAKGPYVELDDGTFMVPFTTTIPGTDVEFELVPIPGGKVLMGSPDSEDGRNDDEGPQVEVAIEPFWMGKYEVTWGEYRHYMRLDQIFKSFNTDGIRQITEEKRIDAVTAPSGLYDPSFTFDAGDGPKQPAATMTQFAAKQYTKWLSRICGDSFFRLPTEAEWEYACRAGTTTAYHFGDDPEKLGEYAWYDDNSDYERHDVGEKKPNPWGLYDMYGNVAEWVLDQYDENGYENLTKHPVNGLLACWPTEVYPRVVRGGSWELTAEECRSASRLGSDDEEWKIDDPNVPQSPWWYTTEPATGVGFRIIQPLKTPESRDVRESFWVSDHKSISRTVDNRIETNGKGAWGIADPSLPKAIEDNKDK